MNKDDLGFDLVGGKDDPQYPNDNSIFVSHVTKGSLAEGKLKYVPKVFFCLIILVIALEK